MNHFQVLFDIKNKTTHKKIYHSNMQHFDEKFKYDQK